MPKGHHHEKTTTQDNTKSTKLSLHGNPTHRRDHEHERPLAQFITHAAQKTHESLDKIHTKLQEAHDARVRKDEEIREEVRRKSHQEDKQQKPRPAPTIDKKSHISTAEQDKIEREKQIQGHLRRAQNYFSFGSYDLAIAEYDLAFRASAQISSNIALVYELLGISQFLHKPQAADIYVKIAECYIRLKKYDIALTYLRQLDFFGSPIIDIKTRIKVCETEKQQLERQQSEQQFKQSTKSVTFDINPPKIVKEHPVPIWEQKKEQFIETAKKLLAEDPDNIGWLSTIKNSLQATTQSTNLEKLQALNTCIELYEKYNISPTQEEKEYYSKLSTFRWKIREEERQKRLAEEKILHTKKAQEAETLITQMLQAAQEALNICKVQDALKILNEAQELARNNYPTHMLNENYRNKNYFIDLIYELNCELNDYINTRNQKSVQYANNILDDAMPLKPYGDKKILFWVHRERLVHEISTELKLHWDTFYRKSEDELNITLFKEMSDLIRKDLLPMHFLKCVGRFSWDDVYINHSKAMGPVLRKMIETYVPTSEKFKVRLNILPQTASQVDNNNVPVAATVIYDWWSILNNWPASSFDLQHVENTAAFIETASVVTSAEEEAVKPKSYSPKF